MFRTHVPIAHISDGPGACTAHSTRRSARLSTSSRAHQLSRTATSPAHIDSQASSLSRKPVTWDSAPSAPRIISSTGRDAGVNKQSKAQTTRRSSVSTESAVVRAARSSSWSAEDDATLVKARGQGLNWNQIAPKHFPSKTPNACRKRHERLQERQNSEQWDGPKLDILAMAYMEVRRDMWSILAAKVGEKWTSLEQKCVEKGLKNLAQASRSAQKRQENGSFMQSDSGIDNHNIDEQSSPKDLAPAAMCPGHYSQQRIPNIQAIVHPGSLVRFVNNEQSSISTLGDASAGNKSKSKVDFPRNEGLGSESTTRPGMTQELSAITARMISQVPRCPQQGDGLDEDYLMRHAENDVELVPSGHIQNNPSPSSSPVAQPRSGDMSSGSNISEDEALDMTEDCLGESSVECINDLDTQKEQILTRLMVCFYEMFAAKDYSPGRRHTSSTPSTSKQVNSTSRNGSEPTTKKRKSDERRDDEDQGEDDDEVDRPGKRQKRSDGSTSIEIETGKRLACPYYKQNQQRVHASGACSGPGWLTIARLKGHIYRQHAMPLHCRRCYAKFDHESQMTEHSRLFDGCTMTDAKPIEGFDKDQEKRLKDKSSMFRAESEAHKWKIVYLILFPNTAPSDMPSPYYDSEVQTSAAQVDHGSPKAQELKQLDAFLSRELPRKVRKALEKAMEKIIGPIEETLKNELEEIVRNCQEELLRNFQSPAQSTVSSTRGPSGPKPQSAALHPPFFIETSASSSDLDPATDNNGLSQYLLPPDSISVPWPDINNAIHQNNLQPAWSDSAYFSQSASGGSFMDDSLLHMGQESEPLIDNSNLQEIHFDPTGSLEDQRPASYIGKGKERAAS